MKPFGWEKFMRHLLGPVLGIAGFLGANSAAAAVLQVPSGYATIQAAVSAAQAGDEIRVARGTYCGAVIDKPVQLVGHGQPSIVGCDTGPFLSGALRIGFLLQGSAGTSAASGTSIQGFHFDGSGVSNTNLEPLAFGILARFASDVVARHNRFTGTVQAITNTAGDRWIISQNRVEDLTVFGCPGFCTGGDGIVVQVARGALAVSGGAANPVNRPENNLIWGNRISGSVPDGFDTFGMVGVLVFSADDTAVVHNKLDLPDNPRADAPGQGILITNVCCGVFTPQLPGSRNTFVGFNDARGSEFGIVVEGSGGQNTQGLVLAHNHGLIVIEGVEQAEHKRARFPHVKGPQHPWM